MKLIYFDLDGPILNVSLRYYKIYSKIILELGGKPLDSDIYWELKRHKIDESIILSLSGVSLENLNKYKTDRNNIIESTEYLKLDTLWPEVLDLLFNIKHNSNLKIITCRNNLETVNRQIKELDIEHLFSDIFIIGSGVSKHWEDKFEIIKNNSNNFNLNDIWIVGDTETDVLAGKHLGIHTIAVDYGIRCKEWLNLMYPEYLVTDPRMLYKIFNI